MGYAEVILNGYSIAKICIYIHTCGKRKGETNRQWLTEFDGSQKTSPFLEWFRQKKN